MSRKASINKWMCTESIDTDFGIIPHSIYYEPAFQELSAAERDFYIMLNVHKSSKVLRNCLFSALKEYNKIYDLGMSDGDILTEAMPNNKTAQYSSGYFVIPASHLKEMGYDLTYASKLKKKLIQAGFIKVVWGGKGRYNGWNQNITIYQFCDDWKKRT